MKLLESARRAWGRFKSAGQIADQNWFLQESLTQLQLELENLGYERFAGTVDDYIFPRHRLNDLIKISRALSIKNPVTVQSIRVKTGYVFGRGVKFVARHPLVQSVIDEHTDYHGNQKVLYSHDSMVRTERELEVTGNLFIACFGNRRTGRVVVRTIDMLEVNDIIRDPDDYHTEWFIQRMYTREMKTVCTYYPAWGVTRGTGATLPRDAPPGEIDWDTPIYHVSPNRHGTMKFAIPELYAQHDWVISYKGFLENWSSVMKAYARMAFKMTGAKGPKQAAAARSQFQTAVTLTNPLETNPSPTQGSMAILKDKMDIQPIKTAGSTTDAAAGLPILNMAATASGLPSSFYGDKGGSGATNETLDRPTELTMLDRQELWKQIYSALFDYVVWFSAVCSGGQLAEAGATVAESIDPFTNDELLVVTMPKNTDPAFGEVGVPIDPDVQVKFPELLERNATDRVRALVNALTLFGKPLMDIVPDKRLVATLLLEALNVEDIEKWIPSFVDMWEQNMGVKDGKPVKPYIIPPVPPAQAGGGAEDPSQGGDVGANG